MKERTAPLQATPASPLPLRGQVTSSGQKSFGQAPRGPREREAGVQGPHPALGTAQGSATALPSLPVQLLPLERLSAPGSACQVSTGRGSALVCPFVIILETFLAHLGGGGEAKGGSRKLSAPF